MNIFLAVINQINPKNSHFSLTEEEDFSPKLNHIFKDFKLV
jgi:hypothetical protein